jgi:hypothetical protein
MQLTYFSHQLIARPAKRKHDRLMRRDWFMRRDWLMRHIFAGRGERFADGNILRYFALL